MTGKFVTFLKLLTYRVNLPLRDRTKDCQNLAFLVGLSLRLIISRWSLKDIFASATWFTWSFVWKVKTHRPWMNGLKITFGLFLVSIENQFVFFDGHLKLSFSM